MLAVVISTDRTPNHDSSVNIDYKLQLGNVLLAKLYFFLPCLPADWLAEV